LVDWKRSPITEPSPDFFIITLSYIYVFFRANFIFLLLLLFSVVLTVFILKFKTSTIKIIVKLSFVWIMFLSISFLEIPAIGLSFLSIGISILAIMGKLE